MFFYKILCSIATSKLYPYICHSHEINHLGILLKYFDSVVYHRNNSHLRLDDPMEVSERKKEHT
uniref:Uncharacterized protein n=1 Tax=Arundo donax TaxID=35708 RepID=A0A0A9F1E4_ARUDO